MCAALMGAAITPSKDRDSAVPRPRVIVADDNGPLLTRVVALLTGEFDVVGVVTNGRDLIDAAGRLNPDVIVCDITMPYVDGLEAIRRLRAAGSTAKIIFLTVHDDSDYLREGLLVGAMGYVIKDRLMSDLLKAVHEILAGRQFVSSSPNLQL